MLPHEAAGSGGNGKGKGWVHRTAMGPALVSQQRRVGTHPTGRSKTDRRFRIVPSRRRYALGLRPDLPEERGSNAQCFWNASLPPSASTWMVSPPTKSPARIFRAGGFSSWVWIARLSGRAPYTGSKPTLPTSTERCAPLCPIRSPGHCHRSSSVARAACP